MIDGIEVGLALSPRPTAFAPLLFAGRLGDGLRVASELGFDAVELSLREPADVDESGLRESLDAGGLRLAAVATGQACLFDGLCLASPDERVREATVERLVAEVELAAAFGAKLIVGGVRGSLEGSSAERRRRRSGAVEALRACAAAANRCGTQIVIEAINRYETNFANTAAEVVALAEEVGEAGVEVLLDTFHMNIEEARIEESVRRSSHVLGYVHFADSNRRAPGQGHLDFDAVLDVLSDVGFAGTVSAEILPLPDDATAARQTAEFWAARRG